MVSDDACQYVRAAADAFEASCGNGVACAQLRAQLLVAVTDLLQVIRQVAYFAKPPCPYANMLT